MKWIATCLSGAVLFGLLSAGCLEAHAADNEEKRKLQVVTTLFPLYDWARVVGGEQADVVLLLPPGVEAHSWEPTPRDIVRIHRADLLIYTGRYMEPWVEDMARSVTHGNLLVVDTSRGILNGDADGHHHQEGHEQGHDQGHGHAEKEPEKELHDHGAHGADEDHHHHHHQAHGHNGDPHHGHDHHSNHHGHHHHDGHHHHHHGGQDPHIWLEFGNAQIMVGHIARAFAEKDPQNAQLYLDRAAHYNARLQELDKTYEEALASCRHRTLIYAGHFAFGYFADRYGFDHVSPYSGFSPSAEPSPRRIAQLINKMRDMDMMAVFYEEGVEPRVARVIGRETGARLLLLHGAHNVTRDELAANVTYLSIMEDNLERLKEGLECP